MSAIKNALISCQGASCLYPVDRRPLIQWQLDQLKDVENIIIVASGSPRIIRAVLECRSDAIFALNHGRDTDFLDAAAVGVRFLREPFIYLDGGMMISRDAISLFSYAECPSIGIRRTTSSRAIYVRMGEGQFDGMAIGFTSQPQDHEWVGLAKLHPQHMTSASEAESIHKLIESYAPFQAVHVDSADIIAPSDEDEFDQAAAA